MWQRIVQKMAMRRIRAFVEAGREGVVSPKGKKFFFQDISLYNQLFANKTINVLASGPSIKNMDLSVICVQPCIFVNGAIRFHEQNIQFQNCMWVVSDSRFVFHQRDLWRHISGMTCFFTFAVIQAIMLINLDFFERNTVVLLKDVRTSVGVETHEAVVYRDDLPTIGVSLDISQGFVEAGTVTFIATQLAYYLGAQNIVIYGMDVLNASEPRFYEQADNKSPSKLLAGKERIVNSFDWLTHVYAQHGVTVYNASPISKYLFQIKPLENV